MLLHKVVNNINKWNIFLTLLHYLIHVWIKIDNTETSHISISSCKASSNSTAITNNTVFFLKPCCKFIPCDTIIFFLPKVTKEWPKSIFGLIVLADVGIDTCNRITDMVLRSAWASTANWLLLQRAPLRCRM